MSRPISFSKSFLNAVGDTLLWETGVGNFRVARAVAQRAVQEAFTQPEQVIAHVQMALTHLLRGQIRKAIAEAEIAQQKGEGWKEVSPFLFAVQRLCHFEYLFAKPDGRAESSLETRARQQPESQLEKFPIHWPAPDQNPATAATYAFLHLFENILIGIKTARNLAGFWNSEVLSENLKQALHRTLALLEHPPQSINRSTLDLPLQHHPDLLRADLLFRIGQHEKAAILVSQLASKGAENSEWSLAALGLMKQGDFLLTQVSDLLLWDFSLMDTATASSSLPEQIELQEYLKLPEPLLSQADIYYKRSALLWEKSGQTRGLSFIRIRQAYLAVRRRQPDKAEQWLMEAERYFRATEDFRGVCLARILHLYLQLEAGDFTTCRERAAVIGRWGHWSGDLNYILSLGLLLNRLARHLFLRNGDFEAARMGYLSAQSLFTSLRAPINVVQNTVDQAHLLQAIGEASGALLLLDEAAKAYLQLAQAPPSHWQQEHAHRSLLIQFAFLLAMDGYTISNQIEQPTQVAHFAQQLTSFITQLTPKMDGHTGEHTPEMMQLLAFQQLSDSLVQQAAFFVPFLHYKAAKKKGHGALAASYWERAMQASSTLPPEKRHLFSAILWGDQEKYRQAITAFEQHIGHTQQQLPALSQALISTGKVTSEQHLQFQQHCYFWEQALSMWVKLKAFSRAEAAWQERCRLEDEDWWLRHPTPWKMGSTLAELHEGLGLLDQALHFCDRSLQELDLRRSQMSRDELKTAISNDRSAQFLYHLGARLSFQKQDASQAFHYCEQGKARALLDLLSARYQLQDTKTSQQDPLGEWQMLNAQLQAWRGLLSTAIKKGQAALQKQLIDNIEQGQTALQRVEDQLQLQYPGFHQLVGGKGKVLDVKEVRRQLTPGQLLVSYAYDEDDLFIWVLSQEGLVDAKWEKLPEKELEYLTNEYYLQLQERAHFEAWAIQLAESLLHPIAKYLSSFYQLYIVPSGKLHLLPFHALPFAGTFLGVGRQISMLPSAAALQYFDAVHLPTKVKMLCVGNPTGDLPFAALEAHFIATLFDTQPITGQKATEARIRAALPHAQLIHLATHADLSEESPLSSAIQLTGKDEINLFELMGMQMQAELVVLSACESGKGHTTNGDDVIGLTRGLLAAGAQSAIVSLWSVDDTSTALFMQFFYRHLRSNGHPAASLAHAQVKLQQLSQQAIKRILKEKTETFNTVETRSLRNIRLPSVHRDTIDFSHPYYWAPFFYVGRL